MGLDWIKYTAGDGSDERPYRYRWRLVGELPVEIGGLPELLEVELARIASAWWLGVMRGRHRGHYSGVHQALVREVLSRKIAADAAHAEQLILQGDAVWG